NPLFMKHPKPITFQPAILSFNTISIQTENWELFPYNQKTYFYFETEDSKTISPYYVDFEEESGAYIRQYPLRDMIETATGGCYDDINLDNSSEFEVKEISYKPYLLKQNAYFRYVFQVNSSTRVVHFYPQTNVGESWEMEGQVFTERPYSRLKITCISNQFSSIFSVMDSVKTFEIEAFNGGNPIEAEIEKFSFKISKKYGLIEWFDFRAWALFEPTIKITLAGFEDENGELVGEAMPNAADFYPYSAGDVLKWTNGNKDSILFVEKNDTSIRYTYNRTKTKNIGNNEIEEKIYNEELTLIFFPQNFIDLHYWDLGMTDSEAYQTLNLDQLEDENGEVEYILRTFHENTFFQDCSIIEFLDLGTDLHIYSTRVGIKLEKSYYDVWGGGESCLQLQEAFIGDDYYTPIEENALAPLELKLSPNPTQDHFTIQKNTNSNTPIQLQIFNLQGQSIFQSQFGKSIEISLSDFPKGIYFVQASDGENQWVEKVVKY
ncbi:MAG: T9SS type A sorting domain-containing protein, partial [Chitinophagales bacterium]